MKIEQIEDVAKLKMAETLRQAVADESGYANWDEMVIAYSEYKAPKDFAILLSSSFQEVIGKIIAALRPKPVLFSAWMPIDEKNMPADRQLIETMYESDKTFKGKRDGKWFVKPKGSGGEEGVLLSEFKFWRPIQ